MKKILLSCLMVMLSLLVFAQRPDRVKIRLKSGTTIKGRILGSLEKEKAIIELENAQRIGISYDNIASIKFGKYGLRNSEKGHAVLGYKPIVAESLFFHSVALGGTLHTDGGANLSLQQVNGYFIKPWLGLGLGVGYDLYNALHLLPIYLHIRGYLMQKKVSPFYFVEGGYGHAWLRGNQPFNHEFHQVQGGLVWQVGAGYQINFTNTALFLQLGYKNQASLVDYTIINDVWGGGNVEVVESRTLRRASLSIGLNF